MDNYNMSPSGGSQPMQPMQPVQSMQPIQPVSPNYPGSNGMPGANGMPMVQQVQLPPEEKKDISGLIKTIVIIALSLTTATFIGLFIWKAFESNEAQSDLDAKISVAEANAKDEQTMKLEAEFLEREKYPFKVFAGPVDYGQLTFEYPKTWSVYVAESANSGGDFHAYFNPIQVDTVADETINALRVSIINTSFDEVTEDYRRIMEDKDSGLTIQATTIGKDGNITANRYTGVIPDTELSGIIVTFKIRDKTAILQTDSMLFEADFDKLLGTVVFNQ